MQIIVALALQQIEYFFIIIVNVAVIIVTISIISFSPSSFSSWFFFKGNCRRNNSLW